MNELVSASRRLSHPMTSFVVLCLFAAFGWAQAADFEVRDEAVFRMCFGGPDGKTLFITARSSLYSIPLLVDRAK